MREQYKNGKENKFAAEMNARFPNFRHDMHHLIEMSRNRIDKYEKEVEQLEKDYNSKISNSDYKDDEETQKLVKSVGDADSQRYSNEEAGKEEGSLLERLIRIENEFVSDKKEEILDTKKLQELLTERENIKEKLQKINFQLNAVMTSIDTFNKWL